MIVEIKIAIYLLYKIYKIRLKMYSTKNTYIYSIKNRLKNDHWNKN